MNDALRVDWSAAEWLRAWLATVPIRVSKHGVSSLDFAAYRRGERR